MNDVRWATDHIIFKHKKEHVLSINVIWLKNHNYSEQWYVKSAHVQI